MQQTSKLRCKCWAKQALHRRVLQNVMKMVETKECAEADQPEVRSTWSGVGEPVGIKSAMPSALPSAAACWLSTDAHLRCMMLRVGVW